MLLLHTGVGAASGESVWVPDPWAVAGLAGVGLLAWLYAAGLRRRGEARLQLHPWWRPALFYSGVAALVVALASPVDTLADDLLLVHMVQHMLLTLVGPPLVLLGAPAAPVLRGVPPGIRRAVVAPAVRSRAVRWVLGTATRPAVAWGLYAATLWAWHVPAFYQAAVRVEALHALEHITFVGAATAFWWCAIDPVPLRPRLGNMWRIPYLFLAAIQSTVLAAFITLSPALLYPVYGEAPGLLGLTPQEDQAIAGLVMWLPGGLIYFLAIAVVFFVMAGEEEASARRKEGVEPGGPVP